MHEEYNNLRQGSQIKRGQGVFLQEDDVVDMALCVVCRVSFECV